MKVPYDISNIEIFNIIKEHITLASKGQQKFCKTTYHHYTTRGWVSPKQRQILFQIAGGLCVRSITRKNNEVAIPELMPVLAEVQNENK